MTRGAALNDETLASFFADAYPQVVRRLDFALRPPVSAEDLVQEALVRAWSRETSGETIHCLGAWVGAVAANLGRDQLRRDDAELRAWIRHGPGQLDAAVEAAVEAGESFADAIATLSAPLRDVVVLYYLGDRDVATTAARLGLAEGTVKARLHRARRHLAELLAPPSSSTPTTTTGDTMTKLADLPGWVLAGSHPAQYSAALLDERHDDARVAVLASTVPEPGGFGTLMQTITAEDYRNRRLCWSVRSRPTRCPDGSDYGCA